MLQGQVAGVLTPITSANAEETLIPSYRHVVETLGQSPDDRSISFPDGWSAISLVASCISAMAPPGAQIFTPGHQFPAHQVPHVNQLGMERAMYYAMAGSMVLAKPVTTENISYLKKRWETFVAISGGATVIADEIDLLNDYIVSFQGGMRARPNQRHALLSYVIDANETNMNLAQKSLMTQIRMVYKDTGIKAAELMRKYAMSVDSLALLMPEVNQQAVVFSQAYGELMRQHGEQRMPYIKLLQLAGADNLNHALYPDLYTAAMAWASHRGMLGTTGQFKLSQVITLSDPQVLTRLAVTPMMSQTIVTASTLDNLVTLGRHVAPQYVPPALRTHAIFGGQEPQLPQAMPQQQQMNAPFYPMGGQMIAPPPVNPFPIYQ